MWRFAAALCGLLLLAMPAAADDAGGTPAVDIATMTCRDAVALADADPAAFASLALWLDGWLNGRVNETGYHPATITARAAAWDTACRAAPDRKLAAVADTTEATAPDGGGSDMAFLKCFQFIDMEAEDRARAVAVVRWIDGWHAGALGETAVGIGGHLSMTESALQGCMKRPSHRRNLIRVLAGKHR